MSLFDYTSSAIVDDIRAVLRAQGQPYANERECKAWAKEFVLHYIPTWKPGVLLTNSQAQRVGAAFEAAVAQARGHKREFPKFLARREAAG